MKTTEGVEPTVPERMRRKLRRAGGSKAVVLPKAWLRRHGAEDEVELVESGEGILVLPVKRERSIEDEPEFARFLAFVAKDALAHPEKLGDMADLIEGNDDFAVNLRVLIEAHRHE